MQTVDIKQSQGDSGIHTVEISGCLDAHNFEKLEQVFDSYFDKGIYNLVVEVSRLEYVSSAGAGVFIGAAGRAQANEGNIVVVSPQEAVQEIFELLGVTHIFPVVDAAAKAFSHFTTVSG